ncbi:hypothetical protein GCM10009765_65170 [Fodinicola feengrottensis]|uniref:Uncharacterized protein n=1 Tax=Fodinicola feengrottensis TaxID=435914 RepID=A0ABN2IK96_9ACTN
MAVGAAVNPGSALVQSVQGVQSPGMVFNPDLFFKATRRQRFPMQPKKAINGIGSSDVITLTQEGIVSALEVRVSGTVTFGGTIGTTTMSYEWPLNLIKNLALSANGQSTLISARGLLLRSVEFIANPKLDDNGLAATFGTTAVTSGSLKFPTDDWGTSAGNSLNPGANVPAVGTYTVDLTFLVPIAADQRSLVGSLFAQTSASNLTCTINWNTQGAAAGGTSSSGLISAMGASATFASALNVEVVGLAYSIPIVNGTPVIPDLSTFHGLNEIQYGGLTQGTNGPILSGTGVGRTMLRLISQVTTGATATVPLAVNDTNYATVGWGYGGNTVPESYDRGGTWNVQTYRTAGVNLGVNWGVGLWDFCSDNAVRDVIDQGTTSSLRILLGLVAAPTQGIAYITQETLFAGAVGA